MQLAGALGFGGQVAGRPSLVGAGRAEHPGAGVVLRTQGGGGLWLYYHPLPEVPAGQLLQPGKPQLQLPIDGGSAEVIDSVVAHALCRRKGMNYSTAFYAHVLRGRRSFGCYW